MCPATEGALQPHDTEPEFSLGKAHIAEVIAMDTHAGGMATGAGYLVKLERIYNRIVIIL